MRHRKTQLLREHGMAYRVTLAGLEAYEVITHVPTGQDCSRWTCVERMSIPQLYRWLGY